MSCVAVLVSFPLLSSKMVLIDNFVLTYVQQYDSTCVYSEFLPIATTDSQGHICVMLIIILCLGVHFG